MENPYRAAGTFSGPAYTERDADRELFQAVEQNQRFPYMLAPRQSGKSSLLHNLRTTLDPERYSCGFADLSTFVPSELIDYDEFLTRLLNNFAETLNLAPPKFPNQPKNSLLELLREIRKPRTIFLVDEVDVLRASPFKDTFFSQIRNIFNDRAIQSELKRIQFVLAGAARVEELITDTARSPFNVGKSIELKDFSVNEISSLCRQLGHVTPNLPVELPPRLHYHTGGSVYLTQLFLERLWDWIVLTDRKAVHSESILTQVDRIADQIVTNAAQEIHFRNILRLLHEDSKALTLWHHASRKRTLDDQQWDRLRSTGIAARETKDLYRNLIYRRVFGPQGPLDVAHSSLPELTSEQIAEEQIENESIRQSTRLDLSRSNLRKVPDALTELVHLRSLDLSGNRLTTLPESIGRLSQLEHLNLSGNELSELPESIGNLASLQSLDISGNKFSTLPHFLRDLASLQYLDISRNSLVHLPESVFAIAKLQTLDLSYNRLTALPEQLGRLTQLRTLHATANELTRLPESIGQLSGLRAIFLTNNKLEILPSTLGELTELQIFELSGNSLTSLPDALGRLEQLKTLDLSGNRLTSLPFSLAKLGGLNQLLLRGNPALMLPPELLGGSAKKASISNRETSAPHAILDYYFRARGGSRPLNEIKLILVGRGDVGKTSLVKRLAHDTFTAEGKTEGIKITQFPLTCGTDIVRANVWDFGGQEIMHGTHQFFLTERSLYLLVLNGRGGGEDADVEYWLKLIGSFGGDSPVIVVLNRTDEHQFDLNRPALRQKYPAIRDFVSTDCKTGTGIGQLREVITRETDRLEHVRLPFPANWVRIKERLSQSKDDIISFERFREICRELGEKDEQAQEFLATHLHNLGIALNYKDDSRLRDTSVLNPHWVTTGIYKLLNAKTLSDQAGELCTSQLADLLPASGYPRDKHPFLVELMRKFELCFPLDSNGERYLVPELLGKQEPAELREAFPPESCLNFEYHYTPILPEGLLPRFIVRTYAQGDPEKRWRTGTVLLFEGCSAMVKADVQDRRVIVRVNGPVKSRRALLAMIRTHFDNIHRDFKKLSPAAKVPVPGHPRVLVDYDDLLIYEKEKETHIKLRVGYSLQTFEVSALLEGVNLPSSATVEQKFGVEFVSTGARLFYSYSHKDERLRDELQNYLTPLRIEGLIEPWHDRKILPGDEWDGQISQHLEQADIILLLISSDFVASSYCRDKEVKRAMERHKEGTARVIPIFLRECDWQSTPFAKLKGMPKDAKPLDGPRQRRDREWTSIAKGLRQVISEIQRNRGERV